MGAPVFEPYWVNETNSMDGRRKAATMINSFFLSTLIRAEFDRLEQLRRLEARLLIVAPAEKQRVRGKIESVMEDIAQLSRDIQVCKAGNPCLMYPANVQTP